MYKQRPVIISSILLIIAACFISWLFVDGRLDIGTMTGTAPKNGSSSGSPAENTLACIDTLPANIKVGQKLMTAGYNDQLNSEIPIFARYDIGGVIIMDQTPASELSKLGNTIPLSPFVATDQEGGNVQRYTSEGTLPGAHAMANGFSPSQAYSQYLKDDKYLKSIGITTNFAPVVDVMSQPHSPLPGRMYGSTPTIVIDYASQSIKAAFAAGITPVIKHFPGLGSATGNTDYGIATTDPLTTLQTRDLVPYRNLANLKPDVMVSNAIVPGLTNGLPATWSPAAVKLLRSEGYEQSVIYSDSLTANAIQGKLDDAVIKAWQAGIDVALIVQTSDQTAQLNSNLTAIISRAKEALKSGQLNNNEFSTSLERIFARKGINPCQIKQY